MPAQSGWTLTYYDTPTAAPLAPDYAGIWLRLGARLVDNIAAGLLALAPAAMLAVAFRLAVRATEGTALTAAARDAQNHDAYVATLVGFWLGFAVSAYLYEWLATAAGGGVGKRIGSMRVVSADSLARPGLRTGLIRTLVFLVGEVPLVGTVFVFFDLLPAIWRDDRRTWHDRIAGTIVVYH